MTSVDSLRFGSCDQTDLDKCLMLVLPLALGDHLLLDVEDDRRWCLYSGLESRKCSYVTGESARDNRTQSHTDDLQTPTPTPHPQTH